MPGRTRTLLKISLALVGLILLTALSLAVAQAQAQNLFVANQTGNTIRMFSPTGVDLGYFATTGLKAPVGLAFGPERS
jgi:hypothetical protein